MGSYNDEYDYFEFEDYNLREIFNSIKNKQQIKFRKINPNQYKTALSEFIKYGQFMRFPTKYIFQWKGLVIENIAMLSNLTAIHGHTQQFPFDEFYDEFEIPEEEQDNYFFTAYEMLENEYNIDDYVPFFSNGQPVLSDYGLKPLGKLAAVLIKNNNPEEIIVLINKILDVVHARSDLSELFIHGGVSSLDDVAGFEREPIYHGS